MDKDRKVLYPGEQDPVDDGKEIDSSNEEHRCMEEREARVTDVEEEEGTEKERHKEGPEEYQGPHSFRHGMDIHYLFDEGDEFEYGKIHCNDNKTNCHPEEDHEHRLHECGEI